MNKSTKIFLLVMGLILFITFAVALLVTELRKVNDKYSYDVSSFREIDVEDAINYFEDGNTHVIFIGRKGCSACSYIIPALEEVQKNTKVKISYMDLEAIDRDSEDWLILRDNLTMKSTQDVPGENEEYEEVTETYGYFVHYYGYTPTIIIIKNNKQTGGMIGVGGKEKSEIVTWLTEKIN